jgi:hypothetical protein
MYKEYFPNEFHKEDDFSAVEQLNKLSLLDFYKFCSDYDLVPSYISKSTAANLWECIVNKNLD